LDIAPANVADVNRMRYAAGAIAYTELPIFGDVSFIDLLK